jgi:hypothetical protein
MPVTSSPAATDDRSQRGRRFRRIEEFYNRRTFLYPTPLRRLLFEIKLEKMRIEKQKRLMLGFVSYAPPIYGEQIFICRFKIIYLYKLNVLPRVDIL